MAVALHTMTEQDQIAVLEEALVLLRKPINWCQEEWVCQVYDYEKDTTVDAYCLEGAINQATVNLFGEMRARELGAWDDELGIAVEDMRTPTDIISLNALVVEMYPTELETYLATKIDGSPSYEAMHWQDQEGRTWEDVTGLIRQKLSMLKKRITRR